MLILLDSAEVAITTIEISLKQFACIERRVETCPSQLKSVSRSWPKELNPGFKIFASRIGLFIDKHQPYHIVCTCILATRDELMKWATCSELPARLIG